MKVYSFLLVAIILSACGPSRFIKKSLQQSSTQLNYHTGFVLYDPIKKKTITSVNGDKYFTPASNTKIFTLYAGLKILGDSVPALRWIKQNDSLMVWGTGDPSFLYQDVFNSGKVYKFLKGRSEKLFFSSENFFEEAYGPGWSWDDYQDYYQVERSSFPIYGNLVTLSKESGLQPDFFQSLTHEDTSLNRALERERFENKISINKNKIPNKGKRVVPFITSSELATKLLSDTLTREVTLISKAVQPNVNVLFSMPVDSLYRVMMQASDNFIAEQILLMCAQKISDSLKTEIAIKKVTKEYLFDLPDAPIWVDGSGLSRYNQFTPRSIVSLWEKIYAAVPPQRLFPILTSNGKSGTLRSFLIIKPPFIFGKTGSLANNYCQSGFIVTKKNHLLIFSSMNANFVEPTRRVREPLEKILNHLYERY